LLCALLDPLRPESRAPKALERAAGAPVDSTGRIVVPRHTDPLSRAGHTRAHHRAQRARSIRRRWRQAKRRYVGWPHDIHPSIRRERLRGWPFDRPLGAFSRNPFTRCSCALCGVPASERRADRRRGERA
jgi:hypothetical protein